MKVTTIHRKETTCFSEQQLNMSYNQAIYSKFIAQPFSIDAFEQQIKWKKEQFSQKNRDILVQALIQQYKSIQPTDAVLKNIQSLQFENTFTVITGHQLVAMTGPLYFIIKIAHIIRSAQELSTKYPGNNFIPVFWMATEDHDYEEIKSFHLFNKTYTWETAQSGPVGRFNLNDWDTVIEEFKDLFKNNPENEVNQLLHHFKGINYADAMRNLVHELFKEYGLVIIDGDDPLLKQQFAPIMQKEVQEHFSFHAITDTTNQLEQLGAKPQIIPREINLFYIQDGVRERLVPLEDGTIEIKGIGVFTKEQLFEQMNQHPENFSPNVSLRPLYQEVILPNLCYVGGAGEINYWLQLKGVFDTVNIPFPLIQTRNSMLWIDAATASKIEKLNLKTKDLFKSTHQLTKEHIVNTASNEVDFSEIDQQFEVLKKALIQTTINIDHGLEAFANAEMVRFEKQVEQFKDKLYKSVKGKHEKELKSIQQIKEKLFPHDGLQERYTNFFQLSPTGNYKPILQEIIGAAQPFNADFVLISE